jgi:membrane protein
MKKKKNFVRKPQPENRAKTAQDKRSKPNYYFHRYVLIPLQIFRMAAIDTIRHDGIEHAGYLAFLSILSLFPFLIFLISIVGIFGASQEGIKIIYSILNSAPKEVAQGLMPRVDEIISGPPQSFLTLAIIGVIWTASSSVEGCRTILNRAYRVILPPPYIWRRFLSIIQFFVIIFFILAGLIFLVVIPLFIEEIKSVFHLQFYDQLNFFYLRYIAIFALLIGATSLLYFALPNVKQKITQTIPGSVLAVVLWLSLEKIFSYYLENFHQFSLLYGSLAGIIISLMFFYLIGLVFIFGAEFNYHFHRAYKVFLKK